MAGQDSFTDPPSQNEDMFERLLNVMPPVQGDFDRRWGYRAWNIAATNGPSLTIKPYATGFWNDDPATTRNVVVADNNGLTAYAESGANPLTIGTFAGKPRTANSRGWLYIADGKVNNAWNGSAANILRNWGIDVNNAAGAFGANVPTAGANTGSGIAWTNPGNVASAVNFATVSLTKLQTSQNLTAVGFGFADPLPPTAAIIAGISVTFDIKASVSTAATALTGAVQLLKAGVPVGVAKATGQLQTTLQSVSMGGSADLWGTGWTTANLFSGTFGVQFEVGAGGSNTVADIASIRNVKITIFTKGVTSRIVVGAPSGTGVTLISGRIYFTTFYNSSVGVFSDLNTPSLSTGPITNKSIPLSAIPVSNDTQVDRKKILGTGDGGDETTLYEVADVANSVTTFLDNIDEETLLLSNQWQATLIDGSIVGVADNVPPPMGLQFPTSHRGRVYGLVGSNLYYSKSDDELLTPTTAIAGRFEEEWPPLNYFPVSTAAEQGRGILSDGTVLYIGTDRRVIRLFGDGPATFLEPAALFDNVGILNQDVWKIILIEGNPIGAMWLTPDYRVLGSDFNTYQDVGRPVQNVLDTLNVTALQTAWAANVNISVFNLYVLAVPTGSNVQPDTLLVFDIRGRMWYTWQLTDSAVGGIWWVTLGGKPQFVIQAQSGKLYVFDPTLFQDRVDEAPVSFPAMMRTSWLALGDGTARKYLNEIEVGSADAGMTITVESANTVAEFMAPVTVVANAPLVVKPRGELAAFLAGASTRGKYYRFTFNATDGATDLLRAFSIQGKVLNRI